jgi:hypothetical protein
MRERLIFVVMTLGVLAGCNSAEEKALARERLDLAKQEASIVESSPKDCGVLKKKLGEFETANKDRISSVNSRWTALSESKQASLRKSLRDEANPVYEKLIPVTLQCGAVFPVK